MKILIEAYDKHGLQVLGNDFGQGYLNAKNYRRTLRYKNLRNLAGNRIEQYKILKCTGSNVYDPSFEVLERVYVQDLS